MKTAAKLDLRGLSGEEVAARINEEMNCLFGGWTRVPLDRRDKAQGIADRFTREPVKRPGVQEYTPMAIRWKKGGYGGDDLTPFVTSESLVIPLLDTRMWRAENTPEKPRRYRVQLCEEGEWVTTIAETFALAVCIALLRARGIQVLL